MYVKSSNILRFGIIIGLILLMTGIVIKNTLQTDLVIYIGLLTIILTPLATLLSISIILLFRKDYRLFILSILLILVLLSSIMTALLK